MSDYAKRFIELMESADEELSAPQSTGFRRSGSVFDNPTSPERLKNLFEIIFRKYPNASKTVLYRMFSQDVTRKLKLRVDYYLEERLWATIEARLGETQH